MIKKLLISTAAAGWIGLLTLNPTLATLGVVPPPEFVNLWPEGMSMPEGRYLYDHPLPAKVGEIVVVKGAWQLGYAHNFLIKDVAAIGGQEFCWRPDLGTHTIDGRPMPPPRPEDIARGIPVWRGCRQLGAGEIVGYGRHPASFDSRHFGPLSADRFWGVYRLVE